MDNLLQEIKNKEQDIAIENIHIQRQHQLMITNSSSTKLVYFVIVSGFVYGYYLGRNKTTWSLIQTLITTGIRLKKIFYIIKLFF